MHAHVFAPRIYAAPGAIGTALCQEVDSRSIDRLLIVTGLGPGVAELIAEVNCNVSEQTSIVHICASDDRPISVVGAAELCSLEACEGVIVVGKRPQIEFTKRFIQLVDAGVTTGPLQSKRKPYFIAVPNDLDSLRSLSPATSPPNRSADTTDAAVEAVCLPDAIICDENLFEPLMDSDAVRLAMSVLLDGTEAYSSLNSDPVTDALALQAIKGACECLEAVAAGRILHKRRATLVGALLQILIASQKGLGAARAMTNALWRTLEQPPDHGHLSAVLLPIILDFNAGGDRCERLAEAFGCTPTGAAPYVRHLALQLGLPNTLKFWGIENDLVGDLAVSAYRDCNTQTNPRVLQIKDYIEMFRRAVVQEL